ncbi:MAG TPA: aldolase/citrate lyase family protein, partial [Steroidobacteraceae bacterium]
MSAVASIRSWLFVPGDSARKQEKAAACAADALILDLEDSVTPEHLPQARAQVREFLQSRRKDRPQQAWVRVNAPGSAMLAEDLEAVLGVAPDGIVLPKVSAREALDVARLLTTLEREHERPAG